MSKILLKVNSLNDLKCPVDGFILGIEKFSYIFGITFCVEQIKSIKEKYNDKEIFVSFNRIIYNNQLEEYKKLLKEIDKLNVNGIIIGDVSALTYNLKSKLILDQMHLNNSYYTINHYKNNGLSGVVLTNDITNKEINDINKNSNVILFKQVFGYPHLSTSARTLVTNYLKKFNLNSSSTSYKIYENNSNDKYIITEDDFGTHIFNSKVLNLLGLDINIEYEVIDGFLIDEINEVVDIFMNRKLEKKEYLNKKYNCDTGFINKETIYKVKYDEK